MTIRTSPGSDFVSNLGSGLQVDVVFHGDCVVLRIDGKEAAKSMNRGRWLAAVSNASIKLGGRGAEAAHVTVSNVVYAQLLISREGKQPPQCPHGHLLKPFVTPATNDILECCGCCMKSVDVLTVMYGCHTCIDVHAADLHSRFF